MSLQTPIQAKLFPSSSRPHLSTAGRGIERQFNVPFVAGLALREKQIQQNYRPIIAVHKWFARRPGTLFRALLLSEFADGPVQDTFFQAHQLKGIRVADPFMGGGTPLLEANRAGCDVLGYDINPMAYWIVKQEIERLDLPAYQKAAYEISARLGEKVGPWYRTTCLSCRRPDAQVKYFVWVKTQQCSGCGKNFDLFPGFLLAQNRRHPKHVLVCSACGELNEVADKKAPGVCSQCSNPLLLKGPARRNHCQCPQCGEMNAYPQQRSGPPQHRMFAIEYHCPHCRPRHRGRFFKKPDPGDLATYAQAAQAWDCVRSTYVPDEEIPAGDETGRLHRWGYRYYREMFNERQRFGLELLCRAIHEQTDERIKQALATNLSDLLRYQNMLCRYDTYALKSLDIFSVHGFPVGLIECESNLLGIVNQKTGNNVGSGGWSNIVEKFLKAKQYGDHPFEIDHTEGRKVQIPIHGEWIGEGHKDGAGRQVFLTCGSSTQAAIPPGSLDAVLTDPPYFANVQYAELMDFCYVWLRRLLGKKEQAFRRESTRNEDELTGNATMARDMTHFTQGLSAVVCRMADALKPGAPFAFTYHHRTAEAYFPLAVALLDAGLVCSASLPCPAEMGASIHINGTASSVVDTVFVCRSTGHVSRRSLVSTAEEIARLVIDDVAQLREGGLKPSRGDARCIAYGHLIRLAVWILRKEWRSEHSVEEKMRRVANAVQSLGGVSEVEQHLSDDLLQRVNGKNFQIHETITAYSPDDELSFSRMSITLRSLSRPRLPKTTVRPVTKSLGFSTSEP